MTSSYDPTDIRQLMAEAEPAEYHPTATPARRDLQDMVNEMLANRKWVAPIGRSYLNSIVIQILGGNRAGFKWEMVTNWNTLPPKIRMLPDV